MSKKDIFCHFKKASVALVISFINLVFFAQTAKAEEEGVFTKNLSSECLDQGLCTKCDFAQIIVNVFNFILSIVGALAVGSFIFVGIRYLTAGGSPEKIQSAKSGAFYTVAGLILVLVAWLIVNFILEALGYKELSSWSQVKCE